MSGLERMFADSACADALDDRQLLSAMARFEAALALASARFGLVPDSDARAIAEVCASARFEPAPLAQAAREAGTLAIPFVKDLTARVAAVSPSAAKQVHAGATSQDAIDTAVALCLKEAARRVEALADLPRVRDPRVLAVAKILEKLAVPAYYTDRQLFTWVNHDSVLIALRHGVTPMTAGGFIDYGLYLMAHEHDYARALAFGRAALALVENDYAAALRTHVHFVLGSGSQAFAGNHLHTCIPRLERAIDRVAGGLGYSVDEHEVVLSGACSDCA